MKSETPRINFEKLNESYNIYFNSKSQVREEKGEKDFKICESDILSDKKKK